MFVRTDNKGAKLVSLKAKVKNSAGTKEMIEHKIELIIVNVDLNRSSRLNKKSSMLQKKATPIETIIENLLQM